MEHDVREVTIPAALFGHLRAALEAGDADAVRTLNEAGLATGEAVAEALADAADTPLDRLGASGFWTHLVDHFETRGWGSLHVERPHPGVWLLAGDDWAEAGRDEERRATCAFTSGLLSAVLTRAADAPVAVLETSCRARGDRRCAFAFGSEATIRALYDVLLDGGSLEEALDRLR